MVRFLNKGEKEMKKILILLISLFMFTGCSLTKSNSSGDALLLEPSGAQDLDPSGDIDGDGLYNGQELSLGTDPYNADTDGDGLSDYREMYETGTDPLSADSDGDGFNDFNEIALGMDPSFKDDKDGEREYEMKKGDLTVTVKGTGNIADTWIEKVENADIIEGTKSTIYSFATDGALIEALVEVEYDEKIMGSNPEDISLYYINHDRKKLEQVPTIYDAESGTLKATVTHFSDYVFGSKSKIPVYNKGAVIEVNGNKSYLVASNNFDPAVNGFSFSNFGSSKSPGGNCYGVSNFVEFYYTGLLPLSAKRYEIGNDFSYAYDLHDTYFETGANLYDFKLSDEGLKYVVGFDHFGYEEEWPNDLRMRENGKMVYYTPYAEEIANADYLTLVDAKYNASIVENLQNLGNAPKVQEKAMLDYDKMQNSKQLAKDDINLFNAIYTFQMSQTDGIRNQYLANTVFVQTFETLKSLLSGSHEELANEINGYNLIDYLKYRLEKDTAPVIGNNYHAVNLMSIAQDIKDPRYYYFEIYDNNTPGESMWIKVGCGNIGCAYAEDTYFTSGPTHKMLTVGVSVENDKEFLEKIADIKIENKYDYPPVDYPDYSDSFVVDTTDLVELLSDEDKDGEISDGDVIGLKGVEGKFRVFDRTASQCKVVKMLSLDDKCYNCSPEHSDIKTSYTGALNENGYLLYDGSTLDKTAQAYYESLPIEIQNIIVPTSINQEFVNCSSETDGSAYTLKFDGNWLGSQVTWWLFYRGNADVGARYVYAPSVSDIEYYCGEYLNDDKCFNALFTDVPEFTAGTVIYLRDSDQKGPIMLSGSSNKEISATPDMMYSTSEVFYFLPEFVINLAK